MPVGKTKDAGWEIGVSKTLPRSVDDVWNFVTSAQGVRLWLGSGVKLPAEKGTTYETGDGTTGQIRSFRPGDRVRLTWQPADWDHESTVQVAVSGGPDKAVLRFHQERLANADERERQRQHWTEVMKKVEAALA
jgi:uncharacterized protein YndB with AHSA1/START domain